ncbi:MAG TPA: mechanosensitive ion channel domain-containing protein [Terracidiphilus sp.]
MSFLAAHQQDLWLILSLFCAVVVFGNGLHFILFRLLRRKQGETKHRVLGVQKYLARPARAVLLTLGVLAAVPLLPMLSQELKGQVEQIVGIMLVLLLGWLGVGAVYVFQAVVVSRFDITVADNLRARRIHTQMHIFRRVLIGVVLILDLAAFLWSLHNPALWKFGTGLLASAGLASLILAGAARSTASNLIAGMQIAFTEPIRIDDVVVIEGEWGRIAEITSTYVVVNIWDQRAQIVPLSYFMEQPFTNWTRSGADIMGTAFLYVDYSVPLEPLRAELERVAKASPLWDGRVCGLQVTDLREQTMEIRCLVSSADSGKNFDLRCVVREKMIDFVQKNYPEALPTMRVAARRQKLEHPAPQNAPSLPAEAQQVPNPLESTNVKPAEASAG